MHYPQQYALAGAKNRYSTTQKTPKSSRCVGPLLFLRSSVFRYPDLQYSFFQFFVSFFFQFLFCFMCFPFSPCVFLLSFLFLLLHVVHVFFFRSCFFRFLALFHDFVFSFLHIYIIFLNFSIFDLFFFFRFKFFHVPIFEHFPILHFSHLFFLFILPRRRLTMLWETWVGGISAQP